MTTMLMKIQKGWERYRKWVYLGAIATMMLAVDRLAYELHRLVLRADKLGAIDLKQRYREVTTWFSGQTVYDEINTAVYPPASYGMLRPFLDYESVTFVRWLWALSTLVALIVLVYWLVRESKAEGRLEKIFIAIIPLAIYATSETIGNGQLSIHGLTVIVVGFQLFCGRRWGWHRGLLASGLLIFALIKPTLTLPFLWIVVFAPQRTWLQRVGFWSMLAVGYLALAWWAGLFQDGNLFSLHADWLHEGMGGASWGSTGGGADLRSSLKVGVGYGNIHDWLGAVGLSQWNFPASIVLLLMTGVLVFIYRMVDSWILLGICAIFARLWTYHLVYDDFLAILPLIALFRLTKTQSFAPHYQTLSGVLFGAAVVVSLMPAKMRLMAFPFDVIFKYGQISIWLMMLICLLGWAQRLKAQNGLKGKSRLRNNSSSLYS